MRLERVAFDHPDAVDLRAQMVTEVAQIYGEQRDTAAPSGAAGIDPDGVVVTVVGYDPSGTAVAHALLRRLGAELEIKRMFVSPAARGLGAADLLMAELEIAAAQEGAGRVVLHTGDRQTAAIGVYQRHGYTEIDVYEPYVGMPSSRCFEKVL